MSSSVDRMVARLTPVTAKQYRTHLRHFREYIEAQGSPLADLSFDEWVSYQRADPYNYDILDLAQAWIMTIGSSAGYRRKALSAVKSFFLHNRVELPKDPGFRIRADRPRVPGTLSTDELKMIVTKSNPMYRAIFLSMFQGGLGRAEFIHWNLTGLESVREQISKSSRFLRIDLPGRKRMRNITPYFSIIGRDAISALKTYLQDHRPASESGAIFISQYKTPVNDSALANYWMRHVRSLGYVPPAQTGRRRTGIRYGKNLHELRDLFRTRWEKSPAKGLTAEYLMGHVVDPLEYNKAFRDFDYVVSEYVKAERWLNILSDNPEVVPRAELELVRADQIQLKEDQSLQIQQLTKSLNDLQKAREEDRDLLRELIESEDLVEKLKKLKEQT